jgi:hypothetical protein
MNTRQATNDTPIHYPERRESRNKGRVTALSKLHTRQRHLLPASLNGEEMMETLCLKQDPNETQNRTIQGKRARIDGTLAPSWSSSS